MSSPTGPRSQHWPSLPDGDLFDQRYRLIRVLGQGGCGTVYQVRDETDLSEQDLALKTLHPGMTNELVARGFEVEFSLLARLRHPNLVRVDRFAVAPGPPPTRYFIAELVRGPHLRLAARTAGLGELVRLARAVLQGLDHLHRHGYVHQDVKPGNVLVAGFEDPAGPSAWVPKLTDLGIASVAGAAAGDAITGTVAYLSPERLDGGPADPMGDLWSLGMTLFACAAGRPPVPRRVDEAARWLRGNAIPPLRDVAPDAPVALERLIAGLCAPDRRNRYRTADEALEAVERLLVGGDVLGAATAVAVASDVADGTAITGAAPAAIDSAALRLASAGEEAAARAPAIAARAENAALVGRSDVLAAGAAVLAARRVPAPRAYLLRGPSGSGRSRVLADIGVRAQVAGARFVEVEAGAGLRPWSRALRDLGIDRADYVPSAESMAEALVRAIATAPAVLSCDDLGARDALAAHMVKRVAAALSVRAIGHTGGVIVATSVAVGRDPDPDPPGFVQRSLEPLRPADLEALVSSALGAGAPGTLAPLLWRESGGNPGLSTVTLRALLESGALKRVGGAWFLDTAGATETLEHGRHDRRLDALDPAARALLHALALFGPAGVKVPLGVARVAADLGEGALEGALEGLRAPGLVRLERDLATRSALELAAPAAPMLNLPAPARTTRALTVAHTSEAIRAHCADATDPDTRRGIHARALAALEAAGEDDPAALCHHARGAGRAEQAFHLALRAAEDAAARHDGPAALAAADLALSAFADVPTAPAFGRVALRLRAQALLLTGQLAEAGRVAQRICEEDPSDAPVAIVRAEIALAAGDALATGHAMDHARALIVAGREGWLDEDAWRDAVAELTALEAEAAVICSPPQVALAAAERALAALPPDRSLQRARVHAALGESAVKMGDRDRARREFDTSLALREALGDERAIADGLLRVAMHADISGDHDRAQELVSRGLAHAERAGAQTTVARLLNLQGILLMWTGRSRDAAEAFIEAERRGHLSGYERVVTAAAGNRVVVHQQEGLYGQSLAAGARSWATKRRSHDNVGILTTQLNLAMTYVTMGEARVGGALSRRVMRGAARAGLPSIYANALLCSAWAELLVGDPAAALATLDRLGAEGMAPLASVRNEADAAVLRARVYIALGRSAQAVETLEEATIFRSGPHQFKLAHFYLVRGQALGDLGEDDLRRGIEVGVRSGALAIEWESRARLAVLVGARGDAVAHHRELRRAAEPLRAVIADLPPRLRRRYRSRPLLASLISLVLESGGARSPRAADKTDSRDDGDGAPTTLSPRSRERDDTPTS